MHAQYYFHKLYTWTQIICICVDVSEVFPRMGEGEANISQNVTQGLRWILFHVLKPNRRAEKIV
jgi:hypothetical protein